MAPLELLPNDIYNQTRLENVHPADYVNPTPAGRYNLVVIGAGSAGLVTAIGGAGMGGKVALIEKGLIGGDCLNAGCVPSKSIIRSAKIFGDLARAAELGIEVPAGTKANFARVMARVRRVQSDISYHDSVERIQSYGVDLYLGAARFTGPTTVEVDGQTLKFSKAVIATGSRAAPLPIPGLADAGFLTNESIWELETQPESMAIIGGGPIGVELAQAFQRLGTRVTIFDIAPQILVREDRDAAKIIERALVADGVVLQTNAQISEVTADSFGKTVHYTIEDVPHSLNVEQILLAAGRRPNVENLNLEAAGVAYGRQGVEVNDRLQTTNKRIYGAGDVAYKHQFTHTAGEMARIVLQNALFFGRRKVSDLVVPWVTYSDPEIAHVGMYEQDAIAQGLEVDTYTTPIGETDRGRADGEDEGFVRIHTRKGSDQILGATIVARHAGEMISQITTAMVGGLGLGTLNNVIHPYPTQTEAIKKIAADYNRTRLTPTVARIFDFILRWQR